MKIYLSLFFIAAFALAATSLRADQVTVLKTASTFAVLGASTVTNTGRTTLSGNIGVSPGTAITGFPFGIWTGGAMFTSDANAVTVATDAASAYIYLAGLTPTQTLTGQDLGGLLLTPGVYVFASSAFLTGTLTLDFQNQDNANIVIQTGSTMITASNSTVAIKNQGRNDNLYYEVGSRATLGTYSTFQGDILAYASITLATGVDISCGSAIALTGAVTMDTNNVSNCSSTGSDVTPYSAPNPVSPVPEPGTLTLLGSGLLASAGIVRLRIQKLRRQA